MSHKIVMPARPIGFIAGGDGVFRMDTPAEHFACMRQGDATFSPLLNIGIIGPSGPLEDLGIFFPGSSIHALYENEEPVRAEVLLQLGTVDPGEVVFLHHEADNVLEVSVKPRPKPTLSDFAPGTTGPNGSRLLVDAEFRRTADLELRSTSVRYLPTARLNLGALELRGGVVLRNGFFVVSLASRKSAAPRAIPVKAA